MRGAALALVLLLAAACGTTGGADKPRMYRAYCNTQSRFVGPWRAEREAAEADRQEHLKMYGWHAVRINTATRTAAAE